MKITLVQFSQTQNPAILAKFTRLDCTPFPASGFLPCLRFVSNILVPYLIYTKFAIISLVFFLVPSLTLLCGID